MSYQTVFKRYELKYLLTYEEKSRLISALNPCIIADKYGESTVRNIYFDTDSYLLIRRSIEKPIYKEKLRIRSYTKAESDSKVFVELKKKYNYVVYKRRIVLEEHKAMDWLVNGIALDEHTQISDEIDYFISYYHKLTPKVFLSYQREAYYHKEFPDFRITFDRNINCRLNDLSLKADTRGVPVLSGDYVLMEIKCNGGIPLSVARILSENKLYKTSFSKYGEAYRKIIFPLLYENKNISISMEALLNA